ncbi:hypothetical protein ACJIZ3_003752 [Penstemon smallii]|uniref:Transposase-associated domain-containing protein n=1 Tax=Penstemon smallii TaxID=265156 RepID=A0ABD3UA24_9LAMI
MGMDNFILCPCVKCNNVIRKTTSDVKWIFHGERKYVVDNSEDDLGNNAMDPDDLGDELNELIDEMAEAHKSNNACDVET